MTVRTCDRCGAACAAAEPRCLCCGARGDAPRASSSDERSQPSTPAPELDAGCLLWIAGIALGAAIGGLLGGGAGAGVGAFVGLVLVSVAPGG